MKEIKIQIPEGYTGIDEEASDFANGKIVFKKKDVRWIDTEHRISGYYISDFSNIHLVQDGPSDEDNMNVFATDKQAKAALAMAQLSQIMQNDPRFGGPITDKEWNNPNTCKYIIFRQGDEIQIDYWNRYYHFLAFHTKKQRELFIQENMDLIKQYFMLD